jgi:hypothetical protein
MKHAAFAPAAALLCSVFVVSTAFAQAKPSQAPASKATAQTTAQTPAAPARFVRPVKGIATIEVIQERGKKIGNDIVTVLKIKNTSNGAISLLKVDEYWYNKKPEVVSGDTESYRKPFNPGEIIEMTMRSPVKPDLFKSQYAFSHANGTIQVKAVKKFE